MGLAELSPAAVAALAENLAYGWRDDGTETGVQRVEVTRGNLVALPFRGLEYQSQVYGSTTISSIPSNIGLNNGDGSGMALSVSVAASATLANSGIITLAFRGTRFGVRHQHDGNYGQYPLGYWIDGLPYADPMSMLVDPVTGQQFTSLQPSLHGLVVASDLDPERMHIAEIVFPAFLSGATRQWLLHGWLLDEAAGYRAPARGVRFNESPISLTANTWKSLPDSTSLAAGIRGVTFYNPTAGAVVVNVRYTSSAGTMWSSSLAAGASVTWDPLGVLSHQFEVMSNTTGVFATPLGAG